MRTEKEIINTLLSQFPDSEGHLNKFFESDAELLEPGNGTLLFTTDEFSVEDYFYDANPLLLGWNLAACTLSDVLASGGVPRYYAHSLSVARIWDSDFVTNFGRGIANALAIAGAGFIGGDLGVSDQWKYTGICLGYSSGPVTRKGVLPGDKIYLTGKVGAGNLMAAMKLFPVEEEHSGEALKQKIRFPVRMKESLLMSKYAGACIDTSDGILNALNTMAGINKVGYLVQRIPYLSEGVRLCEQLQKPKTFLFAGECGEYELLFTVSEANEKAMLEQAKKENIELNCLGNYTEDQNRVLREENTTFNFNDFDISARGYTSIDEYLSELTKYLTHARRS